MEDLSVTTPESGSPGTAENLISIDVAPPAPPWVPGNTSTTKIQSVSSSSSSAANASEEGGDTAAAEHFISIDGGTASPPWKTVIGETSIEIRAEEVGGGDMVADGGDRREVVPPEEVSRNVVVRLSRESSAPSAAAAEHFISIDCGTASTPVKTVIGETSTEIRTEEGGGGDVAVEGGDRREVVPLEEVSRNVVKLTCESTAEGGICEVYLIGTAHVSEESCQEVKAVIGFLKPQVVFLELCPSRKAVLFSHNFKVPTMRDMVDMWKRQHNVFEILYSQYQAKVASKLEVFPGSEFRVAYEEALKYDGMVKFGDRAVQITLRRTWAKMPLWQKTKLLYSWVFQALFLPNAEDLKKMLKEMDDVDMLTLVIELSKQFPTLMETLVHERDQYMSATLLEVAGKHSSIVAVVGKGHLQGIKKYWKQPVELQHLLHVDMPSQRPAISAVKLLKTVGVAVAGLAKISGLREGWLFQQ